MDVEEILVQLDQNEGYFPQAAVEEAVAHREEIIPRLLSVLEEVAANPQTFASDSDRMIHTYAMFLLAQFREPRAYPLLVKIFSTPGEMVHDLVGDVVTENLGSILASVSGGDTSGMMELVENPEADEYVRWSALDGLVTLVASGQLTRDETITYFRHLFETLDRTPNEIWNGLASACADLCAIEVDAELRRAYDDDLIDPWSIGWGEVTLAFAQGTESSLRRLQDEKKLITSAVDEMKWWACFEDDESNLIDGEPLVDVYPEMLQDDADTFSPPSFLDSDDPGTYFPETYRRPEPKIGRNEPCPCSSGKKYKKCCGL